MIKKICIVGIALSIFALLVLNIYIIPTGYTGVRIKLGQIQEEPVLSGKIYVTIPFCENIVRINNKQQTMEIKDKIWGETSDKTPVYASDIHITYRIVPEFSTWLYANIDNLSKDLISDSLVSSAIKSSMVLLKPEDITNRNYIEPEVEKTLFQYICDKYGAGVIEINKIVIGDMDFEEAYNNAIQARSIATQEKERVRIENETKLSQAETEKKVVVLQAEAEAQKIKIEAQAKSEANTLLKNSITDNLVALRTVETWDGKLPSVIGESGNIFNLGDILR